MSKSGTHFYLKSTGYFTLVGFVIPGFTAFGTLGLQFFFEYLSFSCEGFWTFIWAFVWIGALALPVFFDQYVFKNQNLDRAIAAKMLWAFNFFEYWLLQTALASFFTDGNTLCTVSDGQNGLEFVFTGWMSLPILLLLSVKFDQTRMGIRVKEIVIDDENT